jgi:hypothetical protein
MSESSLTKRKRTIAFILKDGRRGFAVEHIRATMEGFMRFVDCAVWPEDHPERLMEYTTFDIPSTLIESISEAKESKPEGERAEAQEKPKRRK